MGTPVVMQRQMKALQVLFDASLNAHRMAAGRRHCIAADSCVMRSQVHTIMQSQADSSACEAWPWCARPATA